VLSKKFPFSVVRDYFLKSTFQLLQGTEPSEEERRAFWEEVREILVTPP
jgi:hypothetical protein